MRLSKKIIICWIINFILSVQLFGDCVSSRIYINSGVKAESQILTSSGVLLLDALGKSQRILDSLNTNYPIYFFDGKTTVDVEIIEINRSHNKKTQALIRSAEKLNENSIYALVIECVSYKDHYSYRMLKVKKKSEEFGNAHFFVPIHVASSTTNIFAPHNYWKTNFYIPFIGTNTYFIKAQIAGQHFFNPYIIPFDFEKKEISIYNGDCGGNFNISPLVKYKIRFTDINSKGAQGDHWTGWVEFEIG